VDASLYLTCACLSIDLFKAIIIVKLMMDLWHTYDTGLKEIYLLADEPSFRISASRGKRGIIDDDFRLFM
jgi:hypothetical protein